MAQGPLPPGVKVKVIEETSVNTLRAYGSDESVDKERVRHAMRETERFEQSRISPTGLYDKDYYYNSIGGVRHWNGSNVRTWYNGTHVHLHMSSFYASATIDGHTKTFWFGSNPIYSDAIQLTERWDFKGNSLSVSAGSGGVGGSWAASGKTVTFDSGWVNTAGWGYSLSNLYSGVFADSHVSLYGVDDSATGSHRFGAQFVTAACHGGKRWYLW